MKLNVRPSSLCPTIVASCLLLFLPAALCQEEPAVDRTDPVAVTSAYLEACANSDVDTAISLLVKDNPFSEAMRMMAAEMTRDVEREGMQMDLVLKEFSFMPVAFWRFPESGKPVPTGEKGVVAVDRSIPLDQKFVLRQDDNGLWAIDLVASIKATTGQEKSFLASQFQEMGGRGGASAATRPWECENHLRQLARAMRDFADEHDGNLPLADTWTDQLMPYVLDKEIFKCGAAPELECAYAMNLEVSGMALVQDWQQRREIVLLMEWGTGERNANAFADELENVEPRHGELTLFATADGSTHFGFKGETPGDVFYHKQVTESCQRRMRALCKAIREYAKDHDGLLPGADAWCDDLAPYLIEEPDGAEVFACPATPESPYGYAYNAEIAGKNATEMTLHRRIVILMESDAGTRNASANASEAKAPDRHRATYSGGAPRGSHVGYLSGSVGLKAADQPLAAPQAAMAN
ncbi:MAG: hypothetical protein ACE5JM_05760 [Armatimonadota bacterium]